MEPAGSASAAASLEDGPEPLRLLSLDGGGVRGLSSLIILKYMMQRVNPQSPPKPCEYFHLIGGTSTGGIIALMLGRLKLSVDECIDKYIHIASKAFRLKRRKLDICGRGVDLWKAGGKYRSDRLAKAVKKVVEEAEGDENAELSEPDASCRVFVCTYSKARNTPVLVRSYVTDNGVRNLSTANCTIWEAARATSAASTFFNPIRIGVQEFIDGATGMNNPVEKVFDEANSIWPNCRDRIQCIVSIGTGLLDLEDFGDNLLQIKHTLVMLATETDNTEKRFASFHAELGLSGRYFRFNVDRGLRGIELDEHEKKGAIVAATEEYLETVLAKETVERFVRARAPVNEEVSVSDSDRQLYLNWLPFTDPRRQHNEARFCRTNELTGRWFFQGQFKQWIREPLCFMWLHAKAGAGKTILNSIVIDDIDNKRGASLAFYYFSYKESMEIFTLWRFKCCLLVQLLRHLIRPDPKRPRRYLVPRAFRQLYVAYQPSNHPPMEAIDRVLDSLVCQARDAYFVVDGLDEYHADKRRVVELLARLMQLPGGRRHALVTSRHIPAIESAIGELPGNKLVVPFDVRGVNNDIKLHLHLIVKEHAYSKWSAEMKVTTIDYLTKHADGVFRWADLQIKALAEKERDIDIKKVLATLPRDLAGTYERMLDHIEEAALSQEALAILQWLAYAVRPLTVIEAAELACMEARNSKCSPDTDDFSVTFDPKSRFPDTTTIRRLLSGLVTFTENWRGTLISFSHFSVKEYLESTACRAHFRLERKCGHWFILKNCIAYILRYEADIACSRKSVPYPLLLYACCSSWRHLEELLEAGAESARLRRLFEPIVIALSKREEGKSIAAARLILFCMEYNLGAGDDWLAGRNPSRSISPDERSDSKPLAVELDTMGDTQALLSIAAAGLATLLGLVLDLGTDTNSHDADARIALHTAAAKETYDYRDSGSDTIDQGPFERD